MKIILRTILSFSLTLPLLLSSPSYANRPSALGPAKPESKPGQTAAALSGYADDLGIPKNYLSRLPSAVLPEVALAIEEVGKLNSGSTVAPAPGTVSDFGTLLGALSTCGDTRSFSEEKAMFQKAKIKQLIAADMVDIPAVTEEDVVLQNISALFNRERTAIRNAIPAFKASRADVSIGLWKAVMGDYPAKPAYVKKNKWKRMKRKWDQNPDLPAVYITLADQKAFAQRVSQITGRNLKVSDPDQDEYLIRGRLKNPDGSFGSITTTQFWHGDDENEVQNHAWVESNSGNRVHGVHEAPPIPNPLPPGKTLADYQHPFGLINATGNTWKRASDGSVRGAAFRSFPESTESSLASEGYADGQYDGVGFRLVEDLSP